MWIENNFAGFNFLKFSLISKMGLKYDREVRLDLDLVKAP